jgi:methylglutaconyl-CoA hydratase
VFGFTEVKLGLIPAVISPFVMMKIGKGNCSRYFLTGTIALSQCIDLGQAANLSSTRRTIQRN